jgi:UDPglucose 6-dehydrogenase
MHENFSSHFISIAMDNVRRIFGGDVEYAGSVEECLKDSECTIIVIEWDEFRKLKPEDS